MNALFAAMLQWAMRRGGDVRVALPLCKDDGCFPDMPAEAVFLIGEYRFFCVLIVPDG